MHTRVLGVLSGRDVSKSQLRNWADSADHVLAADAGADLLLEVGKIPNRIVGDFDSVSEIALKSGATVHPVPHQEASDCDKLLQLASELKLPAVTLIGVEGDRLDHVVATLNSAARSDLAIRFVLRTAMGWIVRPGSELRIRTQPNRTVSLLPISAVLASLSGVEWSFSDKSLTPGLAWSLSNKSAGEEVVASVTSGFAFLTIESPESEPPWW